MIELSKEQEKTVAGGSIATDAVRVAEGAGLKALSPVLGPAATLYTTYDLATKARDYIMTQQDAQIAAQQAAAEAARQEILRANAERLEKERIEKAADEALEREIERRQGAGGGNSCVHVNSVLPCGTRAGDIKVGDMMQLGSETDLTQANGEVTFSRLRSAPGFRISTVSGISLVCSDTAPIPTREAGLQRPAELAGKSVAVRRDTAQGSETGWEAVEAVVAVGDIEVQHITVGDRCFWAGESANGYILHHNLKAEEDSVEISDANEYEDYA